MHRTIRAACYAAVAAIASATAQTLDEAVFKGRVFVDHSYWRYVLRVRFDPDHWRGKSEIDRRIGAISLELDGHSVSIPQRAFADLRDAVRVWPAIGDAFHPGQV